MTPVYKVSTKHTKEMLKAFIKFSYQVNHPKATFRLSVFGVMFLLLAYGFRTTPAMYVLVIIGLLVIVFTFTRQNIAFIKLSANDPVYQKQTVVQFTFGQSEFVVTNVLDNEVQNIQYAEITNFYADNRYYYLSVNNEALHIIPKSDFVQGSSYEFGEFMKQKTGKSMHPPRKPIKIQWEEFKAKTTIAWENRGQKPDNQKENK